MEPPILLAAPNVSEGRDERTIAAIGSAFTGGIRAADGCSNDVRLLDVHRDGDHHRSVFTLAGAPGSLAEALVRGARTAIERIDVMDTGSAGSARGEHPYVGALDVAPLVYLDARDRGVACAEALLVADRIGEELGVPVFLY